MLAALVLVAGAWEWCRMRGPDWLRLQFLSRQDNDIGVLEAMALVMALSSWSTAVAGAAVTCYCDNAGVVYSFIKGASKCAEVNMMFGQCWLMAARDRVALDIHKVATAANIADVPTRLQAPGRDPCFARLAPTCVRASLPAWMEHIWCF